jgi:hypothetical protein
MMKAMKKITFGVFLITFVVNQLLGQADYPRFQNIADSIHEEIALFTDREIYIAGENIWFSGIVESSYDLQLSRVAYLELLNGNGQQMGKLKTAINNGAFNGYLTIPEEAPSGIFFIRAYTHLLINYPVESVFMLPLTVVNPDIPFTKSEQDKNEVDFSMELISINDSSKIKGYFRILPELSSKVKQVDLVEENDSIFYPVTYFANGLGKFNIVFDSTANYRLRLIIQSNDTVFKILPDIKGKAVLLAIERQPEAFVVNYVISDETKLGSPLKFKIFSDYGTLDFEKSISDPGLLKIQFNDLKPGINYFVFEDEHSIIDIKPVYNPPPPNIEVKIEGVDQVYSTRERVMFQPITEDNPVAGTSYTVSVVKKGVFEKSIGLLSMSVVYNPILLQSYITNLLTYSCQLEEQIDILMHIYGSELMKATTSDLCFLKHNFELRYLPDQRGAGLSGILIDQTNNTPVEGAEISLSIITDQPRVQFNRSYENGTFIFPVDGSVEWTDLYIAAYHQNIENLEIRIDNDFLPDFPSLVRVTPEFDSLDRVLIDEMYRNYQITKYFNSGSPSDSLTGEDLPFLFGEEMTMVKIDDYIELSSVEEIFKEIVPYAGVRRVNGKPYFRVLDTEQEIFYEDPLILLDNLPVRDVEQILDIHPEQIETIGVINQMYLLGDYTLWGVIYLKTNTSDFAGYKFPEDATFIEYQTLSKQKEWSGKPYFLTREDNQAIPHFSTLLYFNPSYKPVEDPPIEFYTGDDCCEYEITIRGIDSSGRNYYGRKNFEVKRANP